MKTAIVFALLLGIAGAVVAQQVSEDTKQKLIAIYTQYAEAATANERLQYIRNSDNYRELFASHYGDRNLHYTPIRFGNCVLVSETRNIYALEEFVNATQGNNRIEVIQYRYFIKVGNDYKIDWEASLAYNPTTWARFKALKSEQSVDMRCYAILNTSLYDDFFGIALYDNLNNFQVKAYVPKNSDLGMELLDYLQNGNGRPVILQINYVNNISGYSKEVLITSIVQRGWVK